MSKRKVISLSQAEKMTIRASIKTALRLRNTCLVTSGFYRGYLAALNDVCYGLAVNRRHVSHLRFIKRIRKRVGVQPLGCPPGGSR